MSTAVTPIPTHLFFGNRKIIKSINLSLSSSLLGVLTPTRAINGFGISLPVVVFPGIVNTSLVKRWCIEDHIVLSKLSTVNGFDLSLPRAVCVGNKMHKAFPLPVIEFPLPEEIPTGSEESSHCQKKREATSVKIALLLKSRRNCQSKSDDSYTKLVPHVIEFGDSYEVPATAVSAATTGTTSDETGKKKGRTITVTADDMQKMKNDIKARTTLLLSLPDEHQLRFKIEQDDLNQKVLTSLAPEWLMHMIVWRNRSDLDTMSLDDLYNHLKIDEDDMEEMDIKWNMALLSMRDDRGRRDNYRQGSKVEEQAPKALMAIDRVGWDWSYMTNDEENHALIADEETPTEFALMANTSAKNKGWHKLSLDK
nr:hypothetical protein [Tanacetum cinerariifolium]